ncbi:MAG: DNA protecting protein DprA [Candidatus Vogelbacteria bacterium RIFOXYD1_FULL_46_19]|uniref:DNA protecting protein DprA n=1 Tax=Candidatus Vogelbacteria bacterium RIFOXYD1_FULL_46_19 TaxID=1802439 RepID=A0A1G2QFV8_9BACT|nr:MAG: DNA protecting protein DprA [Candidatus Vogelbacteria bacterium RIFOXYD1_FULL_46_19]
MYKVQTLAAADWPPLLNEINDPPKKLWLAGQLPDPKKFTYLTVVGSRHFSQYGAAACRHLIQGLVGQPVVIVSGLALGIDTIAHQTALASDLATLAVPGSGLDPTVLYPRRNLNLAQKIIETGGGLLSEYEPNFRATPYSFPRRNRLMAGLSPATLIIEAAERSGTLITARLALDYNRDVLVVPGEIFKTGSAGPLNLLQDGAQPVLSALNIIDALHLKRPTPTAIKASSPANLTTTEKIIYELLGREALAADDLVAKMNLPISEISGALSSLEIKGLVTDQGGYFYLH